ncbi:ferritin-like domain-containing protein [Skermanella pratensis]|uniref:ferritin-like domain-containing protein n=1 Tax=Skermanella pratensis TaxID=2233999 RepID=UPI001301132D|nr:ferritin-like domain-containing protein [Skermanella pratensis]
MLDHGKHARPKAGAVQSIDGLSNTTRRTFLRTVAVQAVALPAASVLAGRSGPLAAATLSPGTALSVPRPGDAGIRPIIREFADPWLELVRLLREAAEVEHALMVQYLYAAFSLKPAYAAIAGYGAPNADDLLGVAVQEMQHLGAVNRFLVAIGSCPHLERQDFPYEPAIYPFAFHLEPLSRHSLAKYVYTEAPPDALDRTKASPEDARFIDEVFAALGGKRRPNHIGSLYEQIIALVGELKQSASAPKHVDFDRWTADFEAIKDEGEIDHYLFFRKLFTGRHEGLAAVAGGTANVWDLPGNDPRYPAFDVAVDPTAFIGHPGQIMDETALRIAWLGNLEYWTVLCLLDNHYRDGGDWAVERARAHMVDAMLPIARNLGSRGAALPFDALSMGYAPGTDGAMSRLAILRLVREAQAVARSLGPELPGDFPRDVHADTIAAIEGDVVLAGFGTRR